jgi:hypothetical protein
MRWWRLGLVPMMLAAPAQAQDGYTPCAELAAEGSLRQTSGQNISVELKGGTVLRVRITYDSGAAPTLSELTPVLPGISQRLLIFPNRQADGGYRVVSNVVVLNADGTVLLSTFSGTTLRPEAPPQTRTTRLRCPG